MSVTIEGTFKEITKSFADDHLKTTLKSPVIEEAYKFILNNFTKEPSKIVKNSHYY